MAKFESNLFSKASGKLTGLVLGRARTREGKVMTARELVIPLNPQTTAQQENRDRFKSALHVVRTAGTGIYREDWNRGIGKLPGFQSMESVILNASVVDSTNVDIENSQPDVELGDLHFPNTFTPESAGTAGATSTYSASWSTELGVNGDNTDQGVAVVVPALWPRNDLNNRPVSVPTVDDRQGGGGGAEWDAIFTNGDGEFGAFMLFWFRPAAGAGTVQPSLAKAVFIPPP